MGVSVRRSDRYVMSASRPFLLQDSKMAVQRLLYQSYSGSPGRFPVKFSLTHIMGGVLGARNELM